MTITRDRQPDYTGWQTGGRSDPCAGERPHTGVWDIYREYAGGGELKK